MIINPIKKRREEKGLTQVDLALLVGVSQVYISQFETGGLFPSNIHIKNITEILGISPGTLNKELHQFYEARKKELKKRIEGEQGGAKIPV
ncbi:XRE family transcriptional regulator [Candidatus Atribacteria bacterium 1244-E10-H5-B2]|nr:MAG: XRE family transcriptional regulator [Candidatus Atribacteria bacterium 1244-E10-H5-B2]